MADQNYVGKFVWIDAGAWAEGMAVDTKGFVYFREGITRTNPIGTGWDLIPGKFDAQGFKQASIYSGCAMAVNENNDVYFASGIGNLGEGRKCPFEE